MSCSRDAPLGQSVPRLMGWSGSPSTWITCGVTFFALSPKVWIITPQLTEQYGQVERVSVVRAIFSSFACARTGRASNPRRSAAAPPVPTLKKSRLDKPIEKASCQANHVQLECFNPQVTYREPFSNAHMLE